MADGTNNAQADRQLPQPSLDRQNLPDCLVGTWGISGEVRARVSCEWMEGGFFPEQHVDLEQYGQGIAGLEIVGDERPFGADPSEEIQSRLHFNTCDTPDYVYGLEGNARRSWPCPRRGARS